MDTTSPITHVSLCAGYGGIDLGLKRAIPNLRTIAFSEIEAFACANLVSKMEAGLLDPAPIWTNLKTFPWEEFRNRVDILSGGYPCQPFSAAGKRLGTEDPRHLWPFISDGIALMRPSVCFFENVEGHISLGLPDVIENLAGMGYRTTWGIFSASEVGAPHHRKRVFIMAHLVNAGLQGRLRGGAHEERENLNGHSGRSGSSAYGGWPSRPGQPQYSWEPPRVVGNAKIGCNGQLTTEQQGGNPIGRPMQEGAMAYPEWGNAGQSSGEIACHSQHMLKSQSSGGKNKCETQPSLGGNPNGASRGVGHAELYESDHAAGKFNSEYGGGKLDDPRSNESNGLSDQQWQEDPAPWKSSDSELCLSCDNRTDELRLLGNGVVPATAELAFRTLLAEFNP